MISVKIFADEFVNKYSMEILNSNNTKMWLNFHESLELRSYILQPFWNYHIRSNNLKFRITKCYLAPKIRYTLSSIEKKEIDQKKKFSLFKSFIDIDFLGDIFFKVLPILLMWVIYIIFFDLYVWRPIFFALFMACIWIFIRILQKYFNY